MAQVEVWVVARVVAGSLAGSVEVRVESPVEKDLLAGLVLYPVDGGEYVCMCLCYTQRLLSLTYVKHLRNVCLYCVKSSG